MSLDLTLIYPQFNFEMNKPSDQNIYEFENFRLDASHLMLFKDDCEIPLAPKVVETLLVLVESGGEVVGKDDIMQKVWGDSFVEESNLSQNLHRLRKILGSTKDGRPFIETLRRRGYRFVPDVRIIELKKAGKTSGVFIPPVEENPTFQPTLYPNRETQKTVLPTAAAKFSSRAIFFAISAFVLVSLLGFAVNSGWQQNNSSPAENKLRRLTESGNLSGAAISPDGNSLAYVVQDENKFSLRLKNIQTESEIVIIAPTDTRLGSVRFSPDGNFIYHARGNEIFQMPVFGGEARKIASNIWSNFSVSPDGKYVAFPRGAPSENTSSIIVASTDDGGEREVSKRTSPDFYTHWGPAPDFSPDGVHLTAAAGRSGEAKMKVVQINLQTGNETALEMQAEWENIEYLNWKDTDELLISAQKKGEDKNQIWNVKLPEGAVERVTNDFNDYLDFTLSGDKISVVQETENLHLWLYDAESGRARQITNGISRAAGRYGLAIAPDNRVVFTARDKNSYDIFSVDPDSGNTSRLTENAGRRNFGAVVSPDNRLIAFVSDRTGSPRLWLMNTDGTAARRLTNSPEEMETTEDAPYFSADGKWIFYVFYQAGKGALRKIPVDGSGESAAVSETDKNVFEPVPSPDGKLLAHAVYNENAAAPWQIAVKSLEDKTAPEKFFDFPAFRLRVRWMADSKKVVAVDDKNGGYNLWETNLTNGERKPVTDFKGEKVYRFDVSPDRRFYVLSRGNYFYDAILIQR